MATDGQAVESDPYVTVTLAFRTDEPEIDVLFAVMRSVMEASYTPRGLVSVSCNTYDLAVEDAVEPGQTATS